MTSFREFDRYILAGIQKLPDWSRPVMIFASFIGSPGAAITIFISLIAWAHLHKNRQLLNGAGLLLLLLPIVSIIKLLTRRIRPDTMYVQNMRFKTYSFPSGHAYSSLLALGFLAYLAIKYLPGPWGWIIAAVLAVLIFLVGVSRVYLGAHFPTDVIGGWLLGGVVLALVIRFVG